VAQRAAVAQVVALVVVAVVGPGSALVELGLLGMQVRRGVQRAEPAAQAAPVVPQ